MPRFFISDRVVVVLIGVTVDVSTLGVESREALPFWMERYAWEWLIVGTTAVDVVQPDSCMDFAVAIKTRVLRRVYGQLFQRFIEITVRTTILCFLSSESFLEKPKIGLLAVLEIGEPTLELICNASEGQLSIH